MASFLHSTGGIPPQYWKSYTLLNVNPPKYWWHSPAELNTIQCSDGIPPLYWTPSMFWWHPWKVLMVFMDGMEYIVACWFFFNTLDFFLGGCSSYYRGAESPYSSSCLQNPQTWPLHHLSYPSVQSPHQLSKQAESMQSSSDYLASGPYSPAGQYSIHGRPVDQSSHWNHSLIYP